MKFSYIYGEKAVGYEVPVLNEREARAAAAILFVGAFIGLTNGVMLGSAIFSEYFVTFFAIDFTIRVIQPRYSPSLLLGRFFVRNQKPEYVGAAQIKKSCNDSKSLKQKKSLMNFSYKKVRHC